MSMLAERKRKQKFSLNPRGNQWSQDANKFGQKMLEKMGWSKGKGLGAKLDGMTEHIRISHKNDTAGIGFKDSETWTVHESNFSELLHSLSSESSAVKAGDKTDDGEIKLTSLEKKSESSRARVHYHKFLRGKDLSRYSERDLASIFGKKALKPVESDPKQNDEPENRETEIKMPEFGVETHNRGSMLDYFNKKLKNFGKKKDNVYCNTGNNSESESDTRVGFGFKEKSPGKVSHNNLSSCSGSDNELTGENQASKKKCKSAINETVNIKEEIIEIGSSKNKKTKKRKMALDDEVPPCTPKKKRKNKKHSNLEEKGITNPVFDPFHDSCSTVVEKHILTPIDENESETSYISSFNISEDTETTRRNKTKESCSNNISAASTRNQEENNDEKTFEHAYEDLMNNSSVCPDSDKKSKKKKKKKNIEQSGIDNTALNISDNLDNNAESVNCSSHCSNTTKSKKKRKINEKYNLDSTYIIESASESFEVKRKKKRKLENGVDNSCIDSLDSSNANNNSKTVNPQESFEVKNKIKKSKKSVDPGIDNPCINLDDSSINDSNQDNTDISNKSDSFRIKSKLRKSKKCTEAGIDNPCIDLNDSFNSDSIHKCSANDDTKKNTTSYENFEVIRAKKNKKSKENGLVNPFLRRDDSDVNESGVNPLSLTECSFETEVQTSKNEDTNENANFYDNFEVKRAKKNKKPKENGLVNPSLRLDDSDINENGRNPVSLTECSLETEVDTAKKKRKNKYQNGGIDNLSLNVSDPQDSNNDLNPFSSEISIEESSFKDEKDKKKKKKEKREEISDPRDSSDNLNSFSSGISIEEVSLKDEKNKKKKKKEKCEEICNGVDKPCLNLHGSDDQRPIKKKKKITQALNGIDNPSLNLNSFIEASVEEINSSLNHQPPKSRTKSKPACNGRDNLGLNLNSSNEETLPETTSSITKETNENITEISCDLMLNVTVTPVPEKKSEPPKSKRSIQRRKSVRFSDVNEERIIPLNYAQPLITPSKGKINEGFSANNIEENVNMISEAIDKFQAEVENDINEAKLNEIENIEIMVGEISDPNGENELLPSGETKLKLKHATFGRAPIWENKDVVNYAKKSYKHLIKGDIVLGFKNTNLHEVKGYSLK